tara:strand:- start:421 stop:555 length:135 start_codon:yes stop_codon:yes gene_type:complete
MSESEIRDLVGAPSIEEEIKYKEGYCCCGVKDCPNAYEHATKGF